RPGVAQPAAQNAPAAQAGDAEPRHAGARKLTFRIDLVVREEKDGQQKTLATPVLLAVEGETASFHSGGELAVVLGGGVEFVPFGTSVTVAPTLAKNGAVRLDLALGQTTAAQQKKGRLDLATQSARTIRLVGLNDPATVGLKVAGQPAWHLEVTATLTAVH